MSAPKCRNGHERSPQNRTSDGKCRRCRTLAQYRYEARRAGAPMCLNGHGLIFGNRSADGTCVECSQPAARSEAGPPPPPDTWLDWAAVYQAIQGKPLVRALTKYETLCALVTVCRRNLWERTEAGNWLRENTHMHVPADNGEHLELRWAPRQGLPLLTVTEAIRHQNQPDVYAAMCGGETVEVEEDAA